MRSSEIIARHPEFYRKYEVPDHVALHMRRPAAASQYLERFSPQPF